MQDPNVFENPICKTLINSLLTTLNSCWRPIYLQWCPNRWLLKPFVTLLSLTRLLFKWDRCTHINVLLRRRSLIANHFAVLLNYSTNEIRCGQIRIYILVSECILALMRSISQRPCFLQCLILQRYIRPLKPRTNLHQVCVEYMMVALRSVYIPVYAYISKLFPRNHDVVISVLLNLWF